MLGRQPALPHYHVHLARWDVGRHIGVARYHRLQVVTLHPCRTYMLQFGKKKKKKFIKNDILCWQVGSRWVRIPPSYTVSRSEFFFNRWWNKKTLTWTCMATARTSSLYTSPLKNFPPTPYMLVSSIWNISLKYTVNSLLFRTQIIRTLKQLALRKINNVNTENKNFHSSAGSNLAPIWWFYHRPLVNCHRVYLQFIFGFL